MPSRTSGTATDAPLIIHEYEDALATAFHDINVEWIEAMFRLEATDREVLEHPRESIIEAGGSILFVEARGHGIVGTCALQRTNAHGYELTKMGVRASARGLKAGEFLLAAVIARAMGLTACRTYGTESENPTVRGQICDGLPLRSGSIGQKPARIWTAQADLQPVLHKSDRLLSADPLYLLTNSRCAAAIHLYEKLGFQHDPEIMARYAARYRRCNVAMRYRADQKHPPGGKSAHSTA